MTASPDPLPEALARLDAFVGVSTEAVRLPDVPAGRMTFSWQLARRFLLQRSEIDDPGSVGAVGRRGALGA